MEWINKRLEDRKTRENIRNDFIRNTPFPNLIIDDFLDEEKAKQVVEALMKEKFEEKSSDLFQFRQTQDFKLSKSKIIQEFYGEMSSHEMRNIVQDITGIKLKEGEIKMTGSLYISTDYFLCNYESLKGVTLKCILFLGENLGEEDGGALVLFEDNRGDPGKEGKRYFPKFNSLVLFEVSKRSWNEVEEVVKDGKERYSIEWEF